MRIPRFYQAETLQVGQSFSLSSENFRHAIQVMRLKVSAPLILFNGGLDNGQSEGKNGEDDGKKRREEGEYLAQLTEVKKKSALVIITSFEPVSRESSLTTKLVLALIKPDKMDFAIQKAVELGVSTIQPVKTERSVINIKASRLEKKMSHWRGIMTSACEQSGRNQIPTLLPLLSFQDYLQISSSAVRIAMLPTASKTLSQLQYNDEPIDLLIGPEGGYTDHEEELLNDNQILSITFGPRILRAETAVVAGLTALQSSWGDCI